MTNNQLAGLIIIHFVATTELIRYYIKNQINLLIEKLDKR